MYETIEILKKDINRLAGVLKKKEYEALFPYLHNKEEQLISCLTGHGPYDTIHSCWFILSNFHVFIIPKAGIGQKVNIINIPLIEIDSAIDARGILLSKLTLSSKGILYTLHDTTKAGCTRFVEYLNNRKKELINKQIIHSGEYLSQIEQLFELKEKGAITNEEYIQEKNKILGNQKP